MAPIDDAALAPPPQTIQRPIRPILQFHDNLAVGSDAETGVDDEGHQASFADHQHDRPCWPSIVPH